MWQSRERREKAHGCPDLLVFSGVAFQNEFCINRFLAWSEVNHVAVLNLDRLRVLWPVAVLQIQGGAERHRVMNQQPMHRRNESDAFAVSQPPGHHLWKSIFCDG